MFANAEPAAKSSDVPISVKANTLTKTEEVPAARSDRIIVKNADTMKRTKDNVIQLKGNVHIIFGENSIMCDEAYIRQTTEEVEAIGDIYFSSPSAIVSGDRLIMNYKTQIGTIFNGVIKMDQVVLEGDIINKKGDREYEAISAEYSACTTCPPAWSFSGSKINATTGGYAHIRNSVLKIVKVPIFWLPYLIVPLNSKRQSGFLFPGFGYSKVSGFLLSEQFFWAISDSTDATITGRFYQRRGYKANFNYRYVLAEQSRGEADVGYISDRIFSNDDVMTRNGYAGKKIDRWHLKYFHTYVLPHDFIQKVDLKTASDLRYARDFKGDFSGWGDAAFDNRVSLTKNTENMHTSVDTSIYVNQLKENPISDNSDAVHRFPEIRHSLLPVQIGNSPFVFNMDTKYNNFARDGYTFDDRTASFDIEKNVDRIGVYNSESDLIRTGQRLDLTPRISAPLALGRYIDIIPSLSYRETDYQFALGEKKKVERRLFRTDVSARTRFSRIFGEDNPEPKAIRYRHEIVPEITHTSIPWVHRQTHPFFGPTDEDAFYASNTALTDSDNLQFDYYDRLYERNLFTFSLSNYLIRKNWSDNTAQYNQIALFRLAQSYDYYESIKRGHPNQPWSDITGLLDVRLGFFETNTLVHYYPYHNVANTAARIKFIHPREHFIQFDFTQTFPIEKGKQALSENRSEDLVTSLGFVMPYATVAGHTTYTLYRDRHQNPPILGGNLDHNATYTRVPRFHNYGFSVTLKPPGNCWGITYAQEHTDTDINYTFNAIFLFDGKNATSISPAKDLL